MLTFLSLIFLVLVSHGIAINLPEYLNTDTFYYSYGGTPMTQFKRFPECFNNNQQSPIDITGSIKSDSDAKLILSDSWWTPRSKEILLNTGHKPQVVDALSEPRRYVTFKGVKYQFANRHYHYDDSDDNFGSEHTLNGRRFVLEAHTFFFKAEYGSKANAEKYSDGILEMAELYQIGERRPSFDHILDNLKYIVYPNQTKILTVNEIPFDIIPFDSQFYYYYGSSSGPKCEENTLWIIFRKIQTLSQNQMNRFRNILRTETGEIQRKNWRYTQERNSRNIFISGNVSDTDSSLAIDEYINFLNG